MSACSERDAETATGGSAQDTAVTEKTDTAPQEKTDEAPVSAPVTLTSMPRPSFISNKTDLHDETLVPSVPAYEVMPDLSNLINGDEYAYYDDTFREQLVQNGFVVDGDYGGLEFFGIYENNRYSFTPSFVTVDSMMHTYHLYFAHLQKRTERLYLTDQLKQMTNEMLAASSEQYEALKGSDWEGAALRNLAYFAVAANLLGEDASVPDAVRETVSQETELILGAEQMTNSPLLSGDEPFFEDYTQYKPRGYYDGEETLERYFRTMMWYGRMTFFASDEELTRSALLMVLAMEKGAIRNWEQIYLVTSFFAGESDDAGYYEYRPAVTEAYGEEVAEDSLQTKTAEWDRFRSLTEMIEPPKINSVVLTEVRDDTDVTEEAKGFRFMGQRFTFDAAVFQGLVYNSVKENGNGEKRMLPDALDVPAALGSDAAYRILEEQGETDYADYPAQMEKIRTSVKEAPDELWTSSLYAGWLKTLMPLLTEKGEGYPVFMQNEEWAKKNVESFLSSWTELKHDTVLYGKQVMAEMGGGPIEEVDDRGYVEPEPVVFGRLASLTAQTRDGLKERGMLDAGAEENLNRLHDLAYSLMKISEKELRNEVLTDEEYELIRIYGGELEHFWVDVFKDETDAEYFETSEFPAPLVTDVATDAENGRVLQVATGRAQTISVIVPIDGTLRVARGCVFSFYQFDHPATSRMTDKDWYTELGILPAEGEEWPSGYGDVSVYQPEWTKSYRYYYPQ
ncbi:MAG: DUF3160 domain-containing protein [Lachnospiraceae bacterium]|nr:DUF3160 domain-containing protein [Lachnospiraceae bacterium]